MRVLWRGQRDRRDGPRTLPDVPGVLGNPSPGARPTVASLRGVSVAFVTRGGGLLPVLENITLTLQAGELVVIIGPSGCGKTTLLNVLSRLSGDDLRVSGEVAVAPGISLGYVFQKDALLPWRTLLGNTEVGLEIHGVPARERRATAMELIRLVGLDGFEQRYPHELSGGMRQRAALIRTLAYRPSLILMDEPFGALDAQTRVELQDELLALWRRSGTTILLVTHDVEEALVLGQRIVVLGPRPARLQAVLTVDLPVTRTASDVRALDRFPRLYREVWSLLRAAGRTP